MKKIILWTVLTVSLLLAGLAQAADYYVRAGATGANNGLDWTNAYTSLPATLTRGNTYYIAGGNYPQYTFDDSLSGSAYITIKKATIADHGTATGWVDSYGTTQATFGTSGNYGMTFTRGYYLIEGQTGGGPGNWEADLGFKLNKIYVNGATTGTVSNIIIRHADIDGGASSSNGSRPVYTNNVSGFTIAYCYVHHAGDDVWTMVTTSNVLVEYSKWAVSYESAAYHPDLAQGYGGPYANLIWRYNFIYDVDATYLWGVHDGNTASGYEIYGNIIVFTSRSNTSDGIVGDLNGKGTINNLKFYNNTIAGDFNYNVGFGPIVGSNNQAYNNLWVKLSGSGGFGSITSVSTSNNTAYNISIGGAETKTGNPLDSEYALTMATSPGIALPSPYNMDMYGHTRGADGNWDRGAVEYYIRPLSPTRLRIEGVQN
jgi:hypothetical protein